MATFGWFDFTCCTMSAFGAYEFGEGYYFTIQGGLNRLAFGIEDYCDETNVDDIILVPMVSAWM